MTLVNSVLMNVYIERILDACITHHVEGISVHINGFNPAPEPCHASEVATANLVVSRTVYQQFGQVMKNLDKEGAVVFFLKPGLLFLARQPN